MRDLDTVSRCIFCDRTLLSDQFVVFERGDGLSESWCVECYREHMQPRLAEDRPEPDQS